MRILNVALFGVLLVLTTVSAALYLYERSDVFHDMSQDTVLADCLERGASLAEQHGLDPRWGIGLVVLILFLLSVFFLRWKIKLPNKAFAFFGTLALVLVAGGLVSVYFWPEDTIRLGTVIRIHRGPREQFLDNLEFLGIAVLSAHLFLFLFAAFFQSLLWKQKSGKKKKLRTIPEDEGDGR
jgi:hypothetical protein